MQFVVLNHLNGEVIERVEGYLGRLYSHHFIAVSLCACVRACLRACMRACVLACLRACMHACMCVCAYRDGAC